MKRTGWSGALRWGKAGRGARGVRRESLRSRGSRAAGRRSEVWGNPQPRGAAQSPGTWVETRGNGGDAVCVEAPDSHGQCPSAALPGCRVSTAHPGGSVSTHELVGCGTADGQQILTVFFFNIKVPEMLSKFLFTCKHKFLTIFIASIRMNFTTPFGVLESPSLMTGKKEAHFQPSPLPWDP